MGRRLRRSFEELRDGIGTRPCLTVLQWNVLADGLAQFGDFEKACCPHPVSFWLDLEACTWCVIETLALCRSPRVFVMGTQVSLAPGGNHGVRSGSHMLAGGQQIR